MFILEKRRYTLGISKFKGRDVCWLKPGNWRSVLVGFLVTWDKVTVWISYATICKLIYMCLLCSNINGKIKETLNDVSALFCLLGWPSVNFPYNQNNVFSESSKIWFQKLLSRENAMFHTLNISPPASSASISERRKLSSIFVCERGCINYHSELYGCWSKHSGWHFVVFQVQPPTYSL